VTRVDGHSDGFAQDLQIAFGRSEYGDTVDSDG